jgi:hypothetical protein
VSPLDLRQRQATLAGAAVAALAVLAIWIPQLGAHVRKGQTTPSLALASGLILAGLLAISLLINKRYIVGFAALFLAFLGPWGNYPLLAIPFAGLAGWLVITAGRQAREEAEAKRREAGDSQATPARGRGASVRGSSSSTSPRPRRGGLLRRGQPDESPSRRKPPASRRYTPPKS